MLLVALRVALGWHFFSQGVEHYHDPNWSSEGFLRQAKGPWADFYKSKVPDFHGFHELVAHPWRDPQQAEKAKAANEAKKPELPKGEVTKSSSDKTQPGDKTADNAKKLANNAPTEGNPQPSDADARRVADENKKATDKAPKLPTEGEPSPEPKKKDSPTKRAEEQLAEELAVARPIYDDFAKRVIDDWKQREEQVAVHYGFDEQQKQKAAAVFETYKKSLVGYLASIENDLYLYQRELRRLDQMQSFKGSNDIPFASKRLGDKRREIANQPNAWLADIRQMERNFDEDLAAIATDEQQNRGQVAQSETSLRKSDRVIVWAMLICGGCLIVGLFTRIAAVACAAFLVLVMMSQPPWVPGTITTLFPYQVVETLALLALATTAVGRWGGLDFFLHFLITAPFRGRK